VTSANDPNISLADSDLVEWSPMFIQKINETEEMIPIPFHKCDENDWLKFHKPSDNQYSDTEKLKQ
jgi:hypothetical protein